MKAALNRPFEFAQAVFNQDNCTTEHACVLLCICDLFRENRLHRFVVIVVQIGSILKMRANF